VTGWRILPKEGAWRALPSFVHVVDFDVAVFLEWSVVRVVLALTVRREKGERNKDIAMGHC
jgi:hypothetical protein